MGHKKKIESTSAVLVQPMFDAPDPRPFRLSDPHGDFYLQQDKLDEIAHKAPGELNALEILFIFQCGLPAGNYLESRYYLPWALGYLRESREDCFEFISDVTWWVSHHAGELERDGVLPKIETAIFTCLDEWTSKFKVYHRSRETCQSEGSSLYYQDWLDGEAEVASVLDNLQHHGMGEWAYKFVNKLSQEKSKPIKSAWYVELVYQTDCKYLSIHRKDPRIKQLLKDPELRTYHGTVILESTLMASESPTYWNDRLFYF